MCDYGAHPLSGDVLDSQTIDIAHGQALDVTERSTAWSRRMTTFEAVRSGGCVQLDARSGRCVVSPARSNICTSVR
jgi:hypothetical protein